jgi:hypothetical protein
MWKQLRVSNPPKRWEVGIVTLIVFVPFYVLLVWSAAHYGLSSLRLVIVVFWIYLILGYFVVKAILRKLASNKR